jgi:epoxyqueuosine reductase
MDRYHDHSAAFARWLEDGNHGSMEYLRRGLERRKDPRLVFPQARSVLAVAYPYRSQPLGSADPSQGPRFARYLEGGDYHDSMKERLTAALSQGSTRLAAIDGKALHFKVCVDTSAVLERTWAWLAGLGWIGKNTVLIHPTWGSYLFLAIAFLDREFGREPAPLASYCGNCRRCLDGCPTGAFVAERVLDSRKCISALTLEDRGPRPEDEAFRKRMGTWLAGCDICQEVCPFNLRRSRKDAESAASAPILTPGGDNWHELLDLEIAHGYREASRESAIARVKPEMFRRNLANALVNAIDSAPDSRNWLELLPRIERLIVDSPSSEASKSWQEAGVAAIRSQQRSPSSSP